MPSKPKKQCVVQGCPELCKNGIRCEKHRKEFEQNRETPTSYVENIGINLYGYKWQQYRLSYLRRYPICVKCGQEANVVDHITDHRGNLELFWNSQNHQSMCTRCHNQKTYKTTFNPHKQKEIEKMTLDRDNKLLKTRDWRIE